MKTITFKEVAHLYLGCEVILLNSAPYNQGILTGVHIDSVPKFKIKSNPAQYSDYGFECLFDEIKPYLRPLSSMTEEEMIEFATIVLPFLSDKKRITITGQKFVSGALFPTIQIDYEIFNVERRKMVRESRVYISTERLRPNELLYLLHKHFDLFGLIDSKEAMEK